MSRRITTFPKLIDRFITEFEIEHGATDSTTRTYRWTLERMVDALGVDTDPATVTRDDLIDVITTWRRLTASSRAGRISVMHTFWKWYSDRYDAPDPAAKIKRPKKEKRARRRLTLDELAQLLSADLSERDKLVTWILAMTGMRRGDVLNMRWRDVDTDARVVRVPLGKGKKGREVPIPAELARLLAETRAKLEEHDEYQPGNYVCPRIRDQDVPGAGRYSRVERDKAMGVTTPNRIVKRACALAGITEPERISPHDLRRSYALAFLTANPGDLYRLKEALGHADIGTTQLYLPDAERDRVRQAVDRIAFNPEIVTPNLIPTEEAGEIPANTVIMEAAGVEPADSTQRGENTAGSEPDPGLVTPLGETPIDRFLREERDQ